MSWAIWITGLPGSGKSVLARAAAETLRSEGEPVAVLELDQIRKVLTPRPTYSDVEREVVYRALAYMAHLLSEAGRPVIIDATAHRRAWRDLARELIPRFAEVQLVCPVEVCREREARRQTSSSPRGIYARSVQPGATVPGVNVTYEPSVSPELVVDTSAEDVPRRRDEDRCPRPPPGWGLARPGGADRTTRLSERTYRMSIRAVMFA